VLPTLNVEGAHHHAAPPAPSVADEPEPELTTAGRE
jgi:hypothetical protein